MSTVQVREKNQITLPADIRKKLDINKGDFLEAVVEDSRIVLIPKKLIDKDQAWFWTKEWQEGEMEAEEDLRKGRYNDFDNIEDALRWLKNEVQIS